MRTNQNYKAKDEVKMSGSLRPSRDLARISNCQQLDGSGVSSHDNTSILPELFRRFIQW